MIPGTHHVSKYAIADGLAPHDLNQAWFAVIDRCLSGVDRRAFRSGAFFFDQLIQSGCLPHHILPPHASGLVRMRKKPNI